MALARYLGTSVGATWMPILSTSSNVQLIGQTAIMAVPFSYSVSEKSLHGTYWIDNNSPVKAILQVSRRILVWTVHYRRDLHRSLASGKYWEQKRSRCIVFISWANAFDPVNHEWRWKPLFIFGCSVTFILVFPWWPVWWKMVIYWPSCWSPMAPNKVGCWLPHAFPSLFSTMLMDVFHDPDRGILSQFRTAGRWFILQRSMCPGKWQIYSLPFYLLMMLHCLLMGLITFNL